MLWRFLQPIRLRFHSVTLSLYWNHVSQHNVLAMCPWRLFLREPVHGLHHDCMWKETSQLSFLNRFFYILLGFKRHVENERRNEQIEGRSTSQQRLHVAGDNIILKNCAFSDGCFSHIVTFTVAVQRDSTYKWSCIEEYGICSWRVQGRGMLVTWLMVVVWGLEIFTGSSRILELQQSFKRIIHLAPGWET